MACQIAKMGRTCNGSAVYLIMGFISIINCKYLQSNDKEGCDTSHPDVHVHVMLL